MPSGIIAKGLDSHHRAQDTVLQPESSAQKQLQAFRYRPAQLGQKLSVVEKKPAQDNRDAEHILPVRKGAEDVFPQQFTELHHLLGMAAGTEPATAAGEGKQVFMTAVGATHPSKAAFQVAALQIGAHNIGHHRTKKSVVSGELFLIPGLERNEMIGQQSK